MKSMKQKMLSEGNEGGDGERKEKKMIITEEAEQAKEAIKIF